MYTSFDSQVLADYKWILSSDFQKNSSIFTKPNILHLFLIIVFIYMQFNPILVLLKYKSEKFHVDFVRQFKREITLLFFIIRMIK